MPRTLKFRDILIEPGEKKKTYMAVTQTPGGQPLGFPLMVANGTKDGPILLVDGGAHGDEYESGEAIRAIWRDLDPGVLCGASVGVPVVNVPAFEAGRRAKRDHCFPADLRHHSRRGVDGVRGPTQCGVAGSLCRLELRSATFRK